MLLAIAVTSATVLGASPGGLVTGTVRDASGLPLPGATVQIVAAGGQRSETTADDQGRYVLSAPAPGDCEIHASLPGFQPAHRRIRVAAADRLVFDLRLDVEARAEHVTVRGEPGGRSSFSRVLVTRDDLEHVPGALQAGSCTAITELSPSATVAHDQLHVRGGHQVGYAIDGVPVPSASIGSNFALLFDPKDVDGIDFQRGAYSAEYGDRLYGMLDVVTRSGFQRAKGGESSVIVGQDRTLEGAVAYGSHTDAAAYFLQMSGNRADFGLTPPALPAVNDRTWGTGQAARLWIGQDGLRTLTITESARFDDYAIPTAPGNVWQPGADNQSERDAYLHA